MKSVAAGNAEVQADGGLRRTAETSAMNPADLCALEAARLLAPIGEGEVCVFSMGPAGPVQNLLQEAARLGADCLYQISDGRYAGSDTLATARVLQRALEVYGPFDLVLCGERAVDGETGQVPGMLSALLGWPCVNGVVAVRLGDREAVCSSLTETARETLRMPLPAVLGISCGMEGLPPVAVPSLQMLRRAQSIRPQLVSNDDLQLPPDRVGRAGSPTSVIRTTAAAWGRACLRLTTPEAGVAETMASLNGIGPTGGAE